MPEQPLRGRGARRARRAARQRPGRQSAAIRSVRCAVAARLFRPRATDGAGDSQLRARPRFRARHFAFGAGRRGASGVRTPVMTQDEQKQLVAREALRYVVDDAWLGVGSWSTANFFVDELAKIKHRIKGAVASSLKTAERLRARGIDVEELNN